MVLFIAQGGSNFMSLWVKHLNNSKASLKWKLMNGVPVVLTFESVNKNMLMKVYLSSIVHYIKLSIKNYHLLGLLQEQEDPENKNKIF